MKTNSIKVAVVGSGYWGKNLVRNFNQLGALSLICDKDDTTLSQYKEQYPEVKSCLAFSDAISQKEIGGIVISSPAETHYTLAKEVLLTGKHVFVEKPLTLVEQESEELIEIAKEHNLVLMVGHLLQYHPVFVFLKGIVERGELGRINYIYSNRLNLGKIRREENALWSFAPHDISMILTLAGEKPDHVSATGGNYLHNKIADVTTTHLKFPSGLRAHVFVSWLHPFKEQKLVVVGDKKMAVFDDTLPWEDKLLIYPHEIQWDNNIPIPTKADPERYQIEQSEPLQEECRHFLECIINKKKPRTDGAEGLEVLKILNAAQRSLDNEENGIALKQRGTSQDIEAQYFVHPTSEIDRGAEIGEGSKIWHFSHIMSGSKIGKDCNVGQNVVIGPDVTIGNGCKIQNNVSVYKGVTLEEEVFCGPSVVFTNVYNPRAGVRKMDQLKETLVQKGATIGANATIICGVSIGRYAFIGAGAVVTADVHDYALMVGNPAKAIGWVCECGERIDENLSCVSCQKKISGKRWGRKENSQFCK